MKLLTQRHRSGGAHVLIALLIKHVLHVVRTHALLIHKNMIVGWTSRSLDRRVGVKIKVPFERMCDIFFHQNTWNRILVVISRRLACREEADMVALGCYDHSEFWLRIMLVHVLC